MLGIHARIPRVALVGMLVLFVLGAGCWYFIFRPVNQLRRSLRLVAAVQVGQTTKSEFRQMAKQYGVRVNEFPNSFGFEQSNRVLEYLHLAPRTVVETNVMLENGLVEVVSVRASIGNGGEIAYINIREFNARDTSCGHVPVCVKPVTSTMSTTVIFSPSVPISERRHLLSLNWWCLAKLGGCKSSREFFPVAWEQQYR